MGAKYLWGKYCSAIYWELYYTIMGKPFFSQDGVLACEMYSLSD